MLSVLINKSIQTDPILINDFSRLAPLISNKLNGPPNAGCIKPKHVNVVMAEAKNTKHNESSNISRNGGTNCNYRCGVHNHLSRIPNIRRQNQRRAQESIVVNPVSLVQYMTGLPLWQPRQFNFVYGNVEQPVLQPHLSQNYFHRPNQETQRQVQTNANKVLDNSISGLRFWEKISHGAERTGYIFTVMCYNVLAQDLLDQHPYLYTFHSKENMKWRVRWKNILAEINHFHPDILCLQEVQKSHLHTNFATLEQLGYRGLYKQRTGFRTDGCAIYYKHDLLNLIEYTTVEYNQPNVRILDRDNVAIIAKFSPKNHPDKEFVVATTHLLYNPKRQDVRLAQIQLLLTELDRIAFTPKQQYLPVIVTGDLNSTPDSAVYKFIREGKLKYENLSSRSLQSGTNGPKTGKRFLPKSLRITDQCQHADLLPRRSSNVAVSRSEEVKLIELKHSEWTHDEAGKHNTNKDDQQLFASGTLTHNFFLRSVYQHHVNGDVEATTFQDEWISVDYIFYSKRRSSPNELTLLERYRLPTKTELGNTKIPNTNLGSDHLSLVAKFQLKV